MSLSSLQSAFDGGDYFVSAFGNRAAVSGFIARYGIGTRTACDVKAALRFLDAVPARDDIDGADVLIYGDARLPGGESTR
jgi:hypothetical protein